jgi:hypothetical protein
MLDECTGERFEEVLAIFSTAVLKRRLTSHGDPDVLHTITYRLATAEILPLEEQRLISSLLLTYRVALSRVLQERSHLETQCEDFKDLLDLQNRKTRRREEQSTASTTDLKTISELSPRESSAIDQQLHSSWLGDPTWIDIIKNGQELGIDRILRISFDQVWDHVSKRTLFEIEDSSEKGVIDDLERRVQRQRDRLEKWKSFENTFDTKKETASTPLIKKIREPNISLDLRFDEHLHIGLAPLRPTQEDSGPNRSPKLISDGSHQDYLLLMNKMRDELNQAGRTKQQKSKSRGVRQAQQSNTLHYYFTKDQRKQNVVDTEVSTPRSEHQDLGASLNSRAEAKEDAIPTLAVEASKDYLARSLRGHNPPAGHTVDSAVNSQDSPEIFQPTLVERTRRSMMKIPGKDDLAEDSIPALPKTSFLASQDESAPRDERATLLERTRQSMSAIPFNRPPDSIATETPPKKSFPVNQYQTPRKSIIPEEEGKGSTPREDLFNHEADYASVFKSRPKIKTSPHISPELAKVEIVPPVDESGDESDYDWQVESSPLGRLGR